MNNISVIICCYNSALHLPETLKHLAYQKNPNNISIEIIIVNNASTDDTKAVANKEWGKYNSDFDFTIVDEKEPGLTKARLKGIKVAKHELIVFCDDDNWLDENYLDTAFLVMTDNDSIGVLGGRSEAVSNVDFPYWFTTYQGSYAVGVQSISSGDISERLFVWGAGMVFRKSIFNKLLLSGFTNLLSDRMGALLSSGGDSELCRWFLIAGYKLWYDERMLFKHYIPINRLSKTYLNNLHKGFLDSSASIQYYDNFLVYNKENEFSFFQFLKISPFILKWLVTKRIAFNRLASPSMPLPLLKKMDLNYYLIKSAARKFYNPGFQ